MGEWKKVDLSKPPFFFSTEEQHFSANYLTKEYAAVFNKAVQKALKGKNLEYLWSEEGGDEPAFLEDFDPGDHGWTPIFTINADHCSHFGYVIMVSGGPYLNGVKWALSFEQLTPIWIREV